MASDPGHRYSFGAPAGGWPTFDPSGRRVVPSAHRYSLDEHIRSGTYLAIIGVLRTSIGHPVVASDVVCLSPGFQLHGPELEFVRMVAYERWLNDRELISVEDGADITDYERQQLADNTFTPEPRRKDPA